MEREAFARAWRYLGYKPVAKWSALVAAVATGVLYIAFLLVLLLFADLVVNRGKIPAFQDLPALEQEDFLLGWSNRPRDERLQQLDRTAMAHNQAEAIANAADAGRLTSRDRELLWRDQVRQLLADRVNPMAADLVSAQDLNQDLSGHGILSLVVRARNKTYGRVAGVLARLFPWTWQAGSMQPNFAYLISLLVLAILLALLRGLAMFANNYLSALAVIEASSRLRRAIYHHTFRLGTLAFRAVGPSEAVATFTRQVEAVHEGLYVWMTTFCREPVKFALLLALALMLNLWLSLAFLIFALMVWLIGNQMKTVFQRQERSAASHSAEQLVLLQESLVLVRLVKSYLMELFNQARVERQLATLAATQERRYRGDALYRPLLFLVGTLAGLVLLYVTGMFVLSGLLTIAGAITLATALVSLYWPLVSWLDNRRFLRRAYEGAAIIFKFLDRPGDVGQVVGAEFLPPLSHQLEFDKVSLKEPGSGRKLLDNVTLTVTAGQRVGLVGSDDAEKHALVYLLPRFLDPTSGEIRIDERNVRWVTFESLRAQIGIVMQQHLVFNDTVANNIGCGDPGFTLPKIIEASKIAHAHHFIQKLPQGYETVVGEMGHSLGISEQFRIALARAILRDPALLVIEEPAVSLDDDTKSLLDDTYARVLPNRTVIFLPHRISTIRACDQVFLLHKGQVEASGEHRELLSSNQLYRHLQYIEFNEFAEQA